MIDCITVEVWRDVHGFEGQYQVSNYGRVKRIGKGQGVQPNRIKRLTNHNSGYLSVAFSRNNIPYCYLVHRLVAHAFLGEVDGLDINHINGNKHDNMLNNLEIVSRQENIDHAIKLGLINTRGEMNSQCKLTWEQVNEIRSRYIYRVCSYGILAADYGVDAGTIRNVIKRITWNNEPDRQGTP